MCPGTLSKVSVWDVCSHDGVTNTTEKPMGIFISSLVNRQAAAPQTWWLKATEKNKDAERNASKFLQTKTSPGNIRSGRA